MDIKIDESWKNLLKEEFEKEYFINLVDFVKSEYNKYKVYPQGKNIFSAFDHCRFENLKVVILGQQLQVKKRRLSRFLWINRKLLGWATFTLMRACGVQKYTRCGRQIR